MKRVYALIFGSRPLAIKLLRKRPPKSNERQGPRDRRGDVKGAVRHALGLTF